MNSAPRLLLVEDDPNDVFMATLAFEVIGLDQQLVVAHDGQDALDYLQGPSAHGPAGLPRLILLDLNMPRMNGFELLKAVKQHEVLAHIPMVVFTTSVDEKDRAACSRLGASEYLVKPQTFEDLLDIIGTLTARWLSASDIAM